MRIIPKQTRVTIEFFKNVELLDVVVVMGGAAAVGNHLGPRLSVACNHVFKMRYSRFQFGFPGDDIGINAPFVGSHVHRRRPTGGRPCSRGAAHGQCSVLDDGSRPCRIGNFP